MSSQSVTSRHSALASRLIRFLSDYYLVMVVVIVLSVALIVAISGFYPHRVPESLLVRDLMSYRPLLLAVVLIMSVGTLLLPWGGHGYLYCKDRMHHTVCYQYRHLFLPLLCFGLGYANLLVGVVDSYLALQLPFILGILIDSSWSRPDRLSQRLRAKRLLPLVIVMALYLLYTGLVAVGWSAVRAQAVNYWRNEVWLLVIPLYFLFYRTPSDQFMQHLWVVLLRISWVYLITFLIFYSGVLISCGESPLLMFAFDKRYLSEAGFVISEASILMPFNFTHYTYLGVYLLIPVIMTISSRERISRQTAVCVLLGIALYALAVQARYVLLMVVAVGGYAIVWVALGRHQSQKVRRDRLAYIMLGGAILLTLLYSTSPYLAQGYLAGGVRNDILRMSYEALDDIPILIGGGLDYSYNLLLPLQINPSEGPIPIIHFHNQYLQTLVQSGLIGLSLWLGILGSMLWIARRQSNNALIVVTVLWIILCNVDLVSYLSNYLIGMLSIISLALMTRGDVDDRGASHPTASE